MSKRLSKYIAPFDYTDQTLLVLSTESGAVYITFFATAIGCNFWNRKCKYFFSTLLW